jgi:hypothetical protein
MGGKMNRARLVNVAARLLEPAERQVVLGDLAERPESLSKALIGIFGLAMRRQLDLWKDWRPWVALLSIVVPLGLFLSLVSRAWAHHTAIYSFGYANNWSWAHLQSPYRNLLFSLLGLSLLRYLTLIGWAWTIGFAVGSLSRRAVATNFILFALVLFTGAISSATGAQLNAYNAAVFADTLYRVAFPFVAKTIFVLLPAFWGMKRGSSQELLPFCRSILLSFFLVMLTVRVSRDLYFVNFGFGSIQPGPDGFGGSADDVASWQLRLLPFIVLWPAAYMAIATIRQCRQRKTVC